VIPYEIMYFSITGLIDFIYLPSFQFYRVKLDTYGALSLQEQWSTHLIQVLAMDEGGR
jgi:hypothetical protein